MRLSVVVDRGALAGGAGVGVEVAGMSRATEDTHYHVGIIVPDVAAAQVRPTELLGVEWGPVMHLDDIDVRDGDGNDLVLPNTLCYSTTPPYLELIEEVPGSVWEVQRALEPAPHRLLEPVPSRCRQPAAVRRRLPAPTVRSGRRGVAGVVGLPPRSPRGPHRVGRPAELRPMMQAAAVHRSRQVGPGL